jgi:hypothetical protein
MESMRNIIEKMGMVNEHGIRDASKGEFTGSRVVNEANSMTNAILAFDKMVESEKTQRGETTDAIRVMGALKAIEETLQEGFEKETASQIFESVKKIIESV